MLTSTARALRNADHIMFRGTPTDTGVEGSLDAITRGPDGSSEAQVTIPADACRIENYGSGTAWTAGYLLMNAKHYPHWQTAAAHLRAGSQIGLRWVANNQSPVLDDAGLVRDELYLSVTNGNTTHTFMVAVQVGRDNAARMIQF